MVRPDFRCCLVALCAMALAGTSAACLPATNYICASNEQCTTLGEGARCEAGGFCSVDDSECRSQRRYADKIGPLSGECVPAADEIPDAGPEVEVFDAHIDGDGSVIPEPGFVSIAAGNKSICAVHEDGLVYCWGQTLKNFNEVHPDKPAPIIVQLANSTPLIGAIAVSVGDGHACAIVEGGGVYCWGHNFHGQLGKGGDSRFHAEQVPSFSGAKEIFAHDNRSCALKNDNTLWCWGLGESGQLGDGTTTSRSTPRQWGGTGQDDLLGAGVGRYTTCAIQPNTQLMCSGRNNFSQAGNGKTNSPVLSPVNVVVDGSNTPLTQVSQESGGTNHSCAIVADGILCWGGDDGGELGLAAPGTATFPSPIDLSAVPGCIPVEMRGRNRFGCTRCSTGRVACWGEGADGQLGNGGILPSPAAGYVDSLDKVSAIATSSLTGCAINDGRVLCWGSDKFGELGNDLPYGSTIISAVPTAVALD